MAEIGTGDTQNDHFIVNCFPFEMNYNQSCFVVRNEVCDYNDPGCYIIDKSQIDCIKDFPLFFPTFVFSVTSADMYISILGNFAD